MIEERPAPIVAAQPALALRRVHLRSVGPRAARLDPFDLHHRAADGTTAARVLWSLTNTGGKTTLLRLITSVVVPAARAQMGGANIGEYIDTGDTSHVVLEWEIAGGDRLVVGAAYEWPNRKRPATIAVGDLRRYFYMFRGDRIGIDDLPFATVGRRRTLEEFRNEIRELFGEHPAAQFVSTSSQGEWAKLLDTRTPLDPELFRYQMRMNDDEAGAGALVTKLTTPDAIVRFFIEALNDDESIGDFTTTLGDYARQSSSRADMTVEAAFCDAVVAALEPLAEAQVVRAEARDNAAVAGQKVTELAGELAARIEADSARLVSTEAAHDEAAEQAQRLDAELKRQSDMRAQLLLDDARFDAADARGAFDDAEQAQRTADAVRAAWAAADPVAAWLAERARAAQCEEAYRRAEGELVPLRELTNNAAAQLAARYAALVAEAQQSQAKADAALEKARRARAAAERAGRESALKKHDAARQLDAITAAAEEASRALTALRDAGAATVLETAAVALKRWQAAVAAGEAARVHLEELRAGAAADRNVARELAAAASRDHASATETARTARRRLYEFATELGALADDDDVAFAAGELIAARVDSVRVAGALAAQADGRAGAAERAAAAAEAALADIEAQLARLEATDLLGTGADIEAVKELLVDGGVGAVTGWEWLARNVADPEKRRRRIAARPDVANGVIVSDPARLAQAQEIVTRSGIETRVAVLVAPSNGTTVTGPAPAGFVVEPHRALWDREWAERTRVQMRARRDQLAAAAEEARSNAGRFRRATAALNQLVRRWPVDVAEALPGELTAAEHTLGVATTRLSAADGALTAAEGDLERAHGAVNDAVSAAVDAKLHVERCGAAARLEARAEAAEASRAGTDAALVAAAAALGAAEAALIAADEAVTDSQARIADARAQGQRYRERQEAVGVEPADTVPTGSLDELDACWSQLRSDLTAAEAGSDHAARLREAQQRAASARAVVDGLPAEVAAEAERLVGTFEGSNPQQRTRELQRATDAMRVADVAFADARIRLERADAVAEERKPTDRLVHYALDDDWAVHRRAEVAQRLARLATMTSEHRAALNATQGEVTALAEELARSAAELDRVKLALENLGVEPLPGMRPFAGSALDAQQASRDRLTAQREAVEGAAIAQEWWRDALDKVRAAAQAGTWAGLSSPWKERCIVGDAEEIAAGAAGWARDLAIRSRSLAEDLSELDRHRDLLVFSLEQLCGTQLRLLSDVTRASRLPEGLGGISGHPAFKIDFDKAPPAEARGKLAVRVDDWAAQLATDPKRGGRGDQRFRWIADATRDLVVDRPRAGAFNVAVLKPVIDGTVEYRAPERIEVEFSGGQELTLAVLLYCTLSQVRAQNRHSGARPAGVLLLDNPFGAASNAALIRMQQALAASAGLQLVCATGLSDASVKTGFEGDENCILELRNDRDQRHGLQYLRVADPAVLPVLAAGLAKGRDPDLADGHVEGTRYTIRRER